MGELKTQCRECGAEILVATAQQNDGICMACKNSATPERARRRVLISHGIDPGANLPWSRTPWASEIVSILQRIIANEIGPAEASSRLAPLARDALGKGYGDKWIHPDWDVFYRVAQTNDAVERSDSDHATGAISRDEVHNAALKLLEEAQQ